jgi:transcriptional regulator with XRE-family HTH domain
MQTYGAKIRKYRLQRQLSQLDLEIAAEMAPGSISRIEHDKINPTKETLFKLARVLKLAQNEIIDFLCFNEVFSAQRKSFKQLNFQ